MARAYFSGEFSVKELHEKYNIDERRLYFYIDKVKRGQKLYDELGQRRKLDVTSIGRLTTMVTQNPIIDERALRDEIRQASRILNGTTRNMDVNMKPKPIYPSSVRRYSAALRDNAQQWVGGPRTLLRLMSQEAKSALSASVTLVVGFKTLMCSHIQFRLHSTHIVYILRWLIDICRGC